MHCPHCGATAADSAQFCSSCGRPLQRVDQLETRTSVSAPPPVSGDVSIGRSISSGAGGVISSGDDDGEGFVPGRIVSGRYRIVGLLGKGGMGRVYRADDLTLGQPVALKFLPRALAQDPARLERFRAEVRTSRKVTHPAVCRVHDIGEADGLPFISMELVEGGDLASLLRRVGRLSGERGLRIARQLCAGLAAAHDRGVVHRDLKPANVMIDDAGTVRITDFGLAGLADEFSGSEVRSGTPAYMAPESAEGREVTALSDIYSLGLVLYEIFTGCRAFDAETEAELRESQRAGGAPDPSMLVDSLDPAIARVIQDCLAIDPGERPRSARAVAAALPGGDPLAAALAAGETPSPELVAECESGGRIGAGTAWLLFAAVVAGLLGVAARRGADHPLARLEAGRSPEVLADRSLAVLERLGVGGSGGDLACGLAYDRARIDELGGDQGDDHSDWDTPAARDLAPVYFWLRRAPISMRPHGIRGRVTLYDPEPSEPGSVVARFDLEGRLLALRVTPQGSEAGAAAETPEAEPGGGEGPPQAAPWRQLIDETPLATVETREVEPRLLPPVFADERRAWVGELHGRGFRLEAAGLKGRLVYAVLRPETEGRDGESGTAASDAGGAAAAMNLLLVIAMLVVGLILARRNLRIGRADRRGAWLIGAAMVLLEFLTFLLGAHHTSRITDEAIFVFRGLGWSLFVGGLCCVFYLALEPMVRKRWPERLVGWTRLRMWKFSDGLVGRELLFGSAVGVIGLVIVQAGREILKMQGQVQRPLLPGLEPFESMRIALCLPIESLRGAVLSAVFFLLLLALLRNLTRHIVPAWILFIALFTAQTWLAGPSWQELVLTVLGLSLLLFALTRFGLLGLVTALVLTLLPQQAPLTLDIGAWYAGPSLLVLAVLVGLVMLAMIAARGGWRASPGSAKPASAGTPRAAGPA